MSDVTTNRQDYDVWKAVEWDGDAIKALTHTSVIESEARPVVMQSDTKRVRRTGDFDVAGVQKGSEYGYDQQVVDYVELIAQKVGGLRKIAEEDLSGEVEGGAEILGDSEAQALSSLAQTFDQGCIGTTAARDGVSVLWNSIYYDLSTAAAGLPMGPYAAGANIIQWDQSDVTASGSAGYDFISNWLELYENGPYFDEMNTLIIASPAWRGVLRKVKDGNGRPYWEDGQPTIGGYRVRWTTGARKHATTTRTPTGSPLMVVANRQLLLNGKARLSPEIAGSNPGTALQRAKNGAGFTSDEALFKAAMKRGFRLGEPRGAAILEYNAGPIA